MASHPCPFTDSELMALWAIIHVKGTNPILEAKLLNHAGQHDPASEHAEASA